jgi:hypothetical protein
MPRRRRDGLGPSDIARCPDPVLIKDWTPRQFCEWVIETCLLFGGSLSTSYKCAAVFAADFETAARKKEHP